MSRKITRIREYEIGIIREYEITRIRDYKNTRIRDYEIARIRDYEKGPQHMSNLKLLKPSKNLQTDTLAGATISHPPPLPFTS